MKTIKRANGGDRMVWGVLSAKKGKLGRYVRTKKEIRRERDDGDSKKSKLEHAELS